MHTTISIPSEEIIFEPTSGLDNTGQVFKWKDEIYRGIYHDFAPFYKHLILSDLGKILFQSGLIPAKITPFSLNGYGLVIKHRTVPVVSYPCEWSSAMLKDAALLTCDIQSKLINSGYTLKDAHPWNILFEDCRPFFIDLGSITEFTNSRFHFFINQFRHSFLYPLLLKNGAFDSIVDTKLASHCGLEGLPVYKMLFLSSSFPKWLTHKHKHRKIDSLWKKSPMEAITLLRNQVDAINIEPQISSFPPINFNSAPHRKEESESFGTAFFQNVLNRLNPKSILQMGFNDFLWPTLTSNNQATKIIVDNDDTSVNGFYTYCIHNNISANPFRMSLTEPTMPHGWDTHTSALYRFKSDLVIFFQNSKASSEKQNFSITQIARYTAAFSKKWAIVALKKNPGTQKGNPEEYACNELRKHYKNIEILSHKFHGDANLFLCLKA